MDDIDRNLYGATQVRELDRRAIEALGISGYALMQRAARACWRALQQPTAPHSLTVVCGPGNNGGDGYELASLARASGCAVRVVAVGGTPRRGEGLEACRAWQAGGGAIEAFAAELPKAEWIVDAIFGTGLARPLGEEAFAAVQAINDRRAQGARVLAVDVPTGIDASTGALLAPRAVEADRTVSFIGRKLGLHTGQGPAFAGETLFDALEVPAAAHAGIAPLARLQRGDDLATVLPRRARTAHKGDYGHVLIVGGNRGMAGAALMAGRAALRSGAGLVSVATRAEHAAVLTAAQPELMCRGCEGASELRAALAKADVIAVGPGLGTDDWARAMLAAALETGKPLVLDADALNLLAADPAPVETAVLTPHPGEAGRLLGRSTVAVQADRLDALHALEARYAAAIVLKGAGSLVSGATMPMVCPYGNPGMATGGMGDALTGVVAALRAQGLSARSAAQAGVLAHALAGDRAAAAGGERGLLPGDLIAALRDVVNP